MATLYVTEPGVQVHKKGERLLVRKGNDVLQDIPIIKVDKLILMGRGVSVTTPTVYALTRQNVEILYLSSRGGFVSRLVGTIHGHSRLRLTQAQVVGDQKLALNVARQIVEGKIINQRVVVQRHAERGRWAGNALKLMESMRVQTGDSGSLDRLRGREGTAAREYFKLLRHLFRPPSDGGDWMFQRRDYYPPPDPINALLSFGYTLLLNELVGACQVAGLDPALGFFHAVEYNRPSMALDLEEEFRPIIVDSIVLYAINKPVFRLKDFEFGQPRSVKQDGRDGNAQDDQTRVRPVFLKQNARQRFIDLYEARVNEGIFYPPTGEKTTYRRIFTLQAYQMARLILGETDRYIPFTVR